MSNFRNADWGLKTNGDGTWAWDTIKVAVLMDIRSELQTLNRLLACPNFLSIPHTLSAIRKNTTRTKRRKPKTK